MRLRDAFARLLRPDQDIVLQLLESQPLTVDDILAASARSGPKPALAGDPNQSQ